MQNYCIRLQKIMPVDGYIRVSKGFRNLYPPSPILAEVSDGVKKKSLALCRANDPDCKLIIY